MSRRVLPEVALAHDYFVQDGGAERAAIELARMFPSASMYTSFFVRERFGSRIDASRVRPWRLSGRIPISPWFRALLPAYVGHFSRLEIPASRVVISSSSTFARGARAKRPAIHIAYIHAPMRFAWDPEGYLEHASFPLPARLALRAAAPALRRWDRWAGRRADVVVANSLNIQRRIRTAWRRDSAVIHPPVDVAERQLAQDGDGFYLVATRLLGYKRVDLAVRACASLDRELVVAGDGPERNRLERLAGRRTQFVGHVTRAEIEDLQGRCRALLVPGVEDFGIAAVEAMAIGKPVVAFADGGVRETVVDGETGVFFSSRTPRALAEAIERLETMAIDPAAARRRALCFDRTVFRQRWHAVLAEHGLGDLLTPG